MEPAESLEGDELRDAVRLYNRSEGRRLGPNLQAKVGDGQSCYGGIILHINIRASLKLVSIVKVCDYTEYIGTTFQFRPGTVEVVKATSSTTGREVVNYLLNQLRIQTDSQNLMLLEQTQMRTSQEKTHLSYRNLEKHECPLLLCLAWARDGLLRRKKLVLADHVPGTQDYSGMSFEGLRAALQILSEEEEAAIKAVQHKFSELKEAALRGHCIEARGLLELRSGLGGGQLEKERLLVKREQNRSLQIIKPYQRMSASFNSPDKSLKPFDKDFCSLS